MGKLNKPLNTVSVKSTIRKDKLNETFREIKARSKPYSCDKCKISFKLLTKLLDHTTKHVLKGLGLSAFPCELCEQSFDFNGSLEAHMISHTGEKAHQCPLCSKRFTQKSHKNRHINMIHALEKPFKCEFCTKNFARSDDLARHTWIHSDTDNFSCNQCSETFKTPYSKRTHVKAHHKTPLHPH